MITLNLNKDGYTGNILIEPNRPIKWSDNVRFIKIFAVFSLIVSGYFLYHGFLLVLPFSGLEILFLSICLYLVFKHYSTCQVLYFTADRVILETGNDKPGERVEYQRYWSKFHVDSKGRYNIPRLSISCMGKTSEIGDFLSYEDKTALINIITNITLSFQNKKQSKAGQI